MSFFSDLFEGNWSNLGTDITHAPSSLAHHPQEIAEVGAATLAALTLGASLPETAGLFGAGELAGLGGLAEGGVDAAAIGGVDLGAADAAFGAFDPGLFAANAADVAGGGIGADLAAAGSEFGGIGGDVAGGVGGGLESGPPGEVGGGLTDTGATGGIPDEFSNTGGGLQPPGGTAQAAGSALQPPGGTPSYVIPSVANAPPGAETGLAGLNSQFGTFDAGAAGGGGFSGVVDALGGYGNIGKWALAGAPLALTLGRGEAQLPSSAQQLQGQAANLSAQGQADLASAKAGVLNQGQTAALGIQRQDAINQWRQTLFNQGVTDVTKDARWPQILAKIDADVTASTQTMIQQNITNALTETGQAAAALGQVAQMQMNADQAFTNNLVNATKSLGLMAAVSGGAKVQQVVNA